MNDTRSQPWPRSWPPFWRTVLHIAIAMTVANIVGGTSRPMGWYSRGRWWLVPAIVGSSILPLLVPALLCRVGWRTASALIGAAFVGLVVACPVFSGLGPMIGTHWAVPVCLAIGVWLTGWLFLKAVPSAGRMQVWTALVFGGTLLMVGWACTFFRLMKFQSLELWLDEHGALRFAWPLGSLAALFVEGVFLSSLVTLPLATIATLLYKAAQEGDGASETANQPNRAELDTIESNQTTTG